VWKKSATISQLEATLEEKEDEILIQIQIAGSGPAITAHGSWDLTQEILIQIQFGGKGPAITAHGNLNKKFLNTN
jgi:hypothetical protein